MSILKRLSGLALATCINIIALGIVIPLLPFAIKNLGGSDFSASAIFSIFSACALISAPLWGRLSDRIGRKPVMLIAIFSTIFAYLWLGFAQSVVEIYASRALAGLTAGWLATAQAYVADVTERHERARGMGLIGAAFGIGFSIGPGIGGATASYGIMVPTMLAAGFAALGLLVTLLWVREPTRHQQDDSDRLPAFKALGVIMADPAIRRLILPYFLVSLVFTGTEGIFAIWGANILQLGAREVGYFLVFAGLVNALIQGAGVGRMSQKWGELPVAIGAVAALAAGLFCFTVVEDFWLGLLPMALLALGMGLHNPAMQSLFSHSTSASQQGAVLGIAQSSASFARIIGPIGAGFLFDFGAHHIPFYVGIVVLLAAVMLLLRLLRQGVGKS